jgi:hypothetical protein
VLINPVDMTPNPLVDEVVWDSFDALATQTLPRKGARPIKRLTALAQALADDGLVEGAGALAHAHLHTVLDSLAVLYAAQITEAREDVSTMDGTALHARRGVAITYEAFTEDADERAVADAYRAAGRAFTADVARTYTEYLAGDPEAEDSDDLLRDARLNVAAMALVPGVQDDLEVRANKFAQDWLDTYRVAIKGLSDDRRAVYDDLRALSAEPQRGELIRPTVRQEQTQYVDPSDPENPIDLPAREHHLLSDASGNYPIGGLNDWETKVLDHEMSQPGFLAWYRNPSTPSKDSLAVSYVDAHGRWRSMRPDFVFFSAIGDGAVKPSIVDPHGVYLSDALPKLKGLADFAEEFGGEFHRIEAVAKVGDELRVLDLLRESTRQAIREGDSAEPLYVGSSSEKYL